MVVVGGGGGGRATDWGPLGSSVSSRSEPVSDLNSVSTNAAGSGLAGKLIKAFIPLDQ